MKRYCFPLYLIAFLFACSSCSGLQDGHSSSAQNASQETTSKAISEEEQRAEHKEALAEFFGSYAERGNEENISDLVNELNLYYSKKRSGTGSVYYKIAATQEDARAVSLDDLTKGDYCIVISNNGKKMTYYDNLNCVEVSYPALSVCDKSRLAPFENGSNMIHYENIVDALAYKPSFDEITCPLDEIFQEAELGISEDQFRTIVQKHGLVMNYRRSNSRDGYVTYRNVSTDGNHIVFYLDGSLKSLEYRDYYVFHRYGVYLKYEASGENMYTLMGTEEKRTYASMEEAIKALRDYRPH